MKERMNLLELLKEALEDVCADSFRLFEDDKISEKKRKFLMKRLFQTPKLHESSEPITFKVVGWILQHDFVIPKVNRSHLRRFWSPTLKQAKTYGSTFRSGRFTSAEDTILVRRLAWLLKLNSLEASQALEMFDEINKLRRRSKSQMYTRLILAAFIGGRKILKYRRIFDVWKRLVTLRTRGASNIQDRVKNYFTRNPGASIADCRQDLNLSAVVFTPKVIARARSVGKKEEVKEDNLDDSVCSAKKKTIDTDPVWKDLLELVLKDQATFDVRKVSYDDVDWKSLSEQMKKSENSLRTMWMAKISPVLALHHAGENYASVEWQRDFLEKVLASGVEERKEIKWQAYAGDFPHQNTHSFRRMFDNLVAKRKGNATMKEVIGYVLKKWDDSHRRLFMAKLHSQFATNLVEHYEHLRNRRNHESDDHSLVHRHDDD